MDGRLRGLPLVLETIVANWATYWASWFDPPFHPPLSETTQALGICVTPQSRIVLVTWNGVDRTLPRGTIERARPGAAAGI